MPRKPIVGGNWKCNPAETAKLAELVANFAPCAELLDKCDVYVCPSNLHVGMVYKNFAPGIMVAPQNCNFGGCGAYTGEMAVDQMKDMGLKLCLIGHSERRGEFGLPTPKECNQLMATKLAYILEKGLSCVFCIGEPLPIREKGIDAVLAECVNQLVDIVPILKALEDKSRVIIAYEPVWAIGTGVTASPEQAQETHKVRYLDARTCPACYPRPVLLLPLPRFRHAPNCHVPGAPIQAPCSPAPAPKILPTP